MPIRGNPTNLRNENSQQRWFLALVASLFAHVLFWGLRQAIPAPDAPKLDLPQSITVTLTPAATHRIRLKVKDRRQRKRRRSHQSPRHLPSPRRFCPNLSFRKPSNRRHLNSWRRIPPNRPKCPQHRLRRKQRRRFPRLRRAHPLPSHHPGTSRGPS